MRRIWMIRSAVVFAVLTTLGSGGCAEKCPAVKSSQTAAPATPADQTPTDDECRQFAASMTKAAHDGDAAAFDRLVDWDAILERATAGADDAPELRRKFIAGFKSANAVDGISQQIVSQVQAGDGYRLLRVDETHGQKRALFRLLGEDSGVNYHDYILVRQNDGKVRAADVFIFLSGESLSQTVRTTYVNAVVKSTSLRAKLTPGENDYIKHAAKIAEMSAHLREGRFQQVLEGYQQLPDSLKKDKSLLLMRLSAASELDEKAYEQAIDAFQKAYPHDAALQLVSIEREFTRKRYAEARAAIDRLDKLVNDPYLNVLRASTYVEEQNYERALECARKAAEQEKDLAAAYWSQVTISLKKKDFVETTRLLTFIEQELHIPIVDLTALPEYAEYVKSPQYAAFAKRKGK